MTMPMKTDRAEFFRLLVLGTETQNEKQVFKPISPEKDLINLYKSLGIGYSASKQVRTLEEEINEGNNEDVKLAASVLNTRNLVTQDLHVIGFYGQQRYVRLELERRNMWPDNINEHVDLDEQGLYAIKLPFNDSSRLTCMIVFAWIHPLSFEPKVLRDTPTYLFRLLTRLTSCVVNCFSNHDFDEIGTCNMHMNDMAHDWAGGDIDVEYIESEGEIDDVKYYDDMAALIPLQAANDNYHTNSESAQLIGGAIAMRMEIAVIPPFQFTEICEMRFKSLTDLKKFIENRVNNCQVCCDEYFTNDMHSVNLLLKAFAIWPSNDELGWCIEQVQERYQQEISKLEVDFGINCMNHLTSLDNLSDVCFYLCEVDSTLESNACSNADVLMKYLNQNFSPYMSDIEKLHLSYRDFIKASIPILYNRFKISQADKFDPKKILNELNPNKRTFFWSEPDRTSRKNFNFPYSGNVDETSFENFRSLISGAIIGYRNDWVKTVRSICSNDSYRYKYFQQQKMLLRAELQLESLVLQWARIYSGNSVTAMTLNGIKKISNNSYSLKYTLEDNEAESFSYRFEELIRSGNDFVHLIVPRVWTVNVDKRKKFNRCITLKGNLLLTLFCGVHGSRIQISKLLPASSRDFHQSRVSSNKLIFSKDFSREILLWDFDQEERKIALVTSCCPGESNVDVYLFNENFNVMQFVAQVSVHSVLSRLVLPLRSICIFGGAVGGILLTDADCESQFYNLNSNRISRKTNFTSNTRTKHMAVLQKVKKGEVFIILEPIIKIPEELNPLKPLDGDTCRVDDAFVTSKVQMSAFATADLRPLPSIVLDLFETVNWEHLSIVSQDDRLVLFDKKTGKHMCFSLDITMQNSAGRVMCRSAADEMSPIDNSHWLWSIFNAYEKFPVLGLLQAESLNESHSILNRVDLVLHFVNSSSEHDITEKARKDILRYLGKIMDRLIVLQKPLYELDLVKSAIFHSSCCSQNKSAMHSWGFAEHILTKSQPVNACDWIRELISFVPVQICRAEKNVLTIMSDGKDEPLVVPDQCSANDVAQNIRFGLMTSVIQMWGGRVIVVTSMGKQSTGKSYFLNHLTGSSFAISGGRCTDGVWMTYLIAGNIMIIVLDFEGLGSIERSEQEDIFLAILNSSISQLTVFRVEMRFDKDIESILQKFQSGINLVNDHPLLFQGILSLNIKDVNPNDKGTVHLEFKDKVTKVLNTNGKSNFLTAMYNGKCKIACWPTLGTAGYYWKMKDIRSSIQHICENNGGYQNGNEFLNCLRLVMAKIYLLDWTSVDDGLKKLQLEYVRNQLSSVIRYGRIAPMNTTFEDTDTPKGLLKTKNNETIQFSVSQMKELVLELAESWDALEVLKITGDDADFDLGLTDSNEMDSKEMKGTVIYSLFLVFLKLSESDISNTKNRPDLESKFDVFLTFVYSRREQCVLKWVQEQVGEDCRDILELVKSRLAQLKLMLTRCTKKCLNCKLGCLYPYQHDSRIDHHCSTDHICSGFCDYCSLRQKESKCKKPAGESGRCDCKQLNHTCGEICSLSSAVNCAKSCSQIIGHDGNHRCDAGIHICSKSCCAEGCSGNCVIDTEREHTVHKCSEVRCIKPCFMPHCTEICGCTDHFHGNEVLSNKYKLENNVPTSLRPWVIEPGKHMCIKSHLCRHDCEDEGICDHKVLLKTETATFAGKRSQFSYVLQEMNGERKMCAHVLNPFQLSHAGQHSCVPADDKSGQEHYCTDRCPCCQYFCSKEIGHNGLHSTSHGNMRSVYFVSDKQEIDVKDRKYLAGEHGIAEMCSFFCSHLGRGHHHYIPCNETIGSCAYHGKSDQRRHCRLKLEPHPNKAMDEILHEKYWKSLGWEDAVTSVSDIENFKKCPYECTTTNHTDENGNPERSFCLLNAWHDPVYGPATGENTGQFQYSAGHKFACKHVTSSGKFHHIFVLDSSGSMTGDPWTDLVNAVKAYISKRLITKNKNCNDIVTVVLFDGKAHIIFERQAICLSLVHQIRFLGGGTNFNQALGLTNEVLSRNNYDDYIPVVLLFSDGCGGDGDSPARFIGQTYVPLGLQAFSIGFGIEGSDRENLVRLAKLMGGQYFDVTDAISLTEKFETISVGLESNVGLVAEHSAHDLILDNPVNNLCTICREEIDLNAHDEITLNCTHIFHMVCVQNVMASDGSWNRVSCPNCRQVHQLLPMVPPRG